MGDTHKGSLFLEDYTPLKRTYVGRQEKEEKCVEEGVAEKKHYEVTPTLIPHPPAPLLTGGRYKSQEQGMKLSLGGMGGLRERCCQFCPCFSVSYFFLFITKLTIN